MYEFKPIPGYEGLYEINKLGQIRHCKFKRMKRTSVTKRGQEVVVLFKNAEPTTFTVSSLVKLTWQDMPIRKNPSKVHCKQIKCIETDTVYESYKQCAKLLGLDYKRMCTAVNKTGEYKGYHFELLL